MTVTNVLIGLQIWRIPNRWPLIGRRVICTLRHTDTWWAPSTCRDWTGRFVSRWIRPSPSVARHPSWYIPKMGELMMIIVTTRYYWLTWTSVLWATGIDRCLSVSESDQVRYGGIRRSSASPHPLATVLLPPPSGHRPGRRQACHAHILEIGLHLTQPWSLWTPLGSRQERIRWVGSSAGSRATPS